MKNKLAFVLACAAALPACGSRGSSSVDGGAPDGAMSAAPACAAGARTGNPAGEPEFYSPGGTPMIVRTPAGYSPEVAVPLIMVYAAAGKSAGDMELRTELTAPATARGYLVVYVDHLSPSSAANAQEGADAAQAVQDAWCVDAQRIFLTGHSDGGSMTHLLVLDELLRPAAVAPSASGVSTASLARSSCPSTPTPNLTLHSNDDSLFPLADGFGADVAAWFADCAGCGAPSAPDAEACIVYPDCASNAEVRYCEGSDNHGSWPTERDPAILDFFDRFTREP